MVHYLHAYFGCRPSHPEDDQTIKFALSNDGRFFRDVAGGRPVLKSVMAEYAVRDPTCCAVSLATAPGVPAM